MYAEVFWIMQVEIHAILFFFYNIYKTPSVLSSGYQLRIKETPFPGPHMPLSASESLWSYAYPSFRMSTFFTDSSMFFFLQTS